MKNERIISICIILIFFTTSLSEIIFSMNDHYLISAMADEIKELELLESTNESELQINFCHVIGGKYLNEGNAIVQTFDNGFIIVGSTQMFKGEKIREDDNRDFDVWLIKYNSRNEYEWSKTYGGDNNDKGFDVQQTSDKGFIITGNTNSYGNGLSDIWIIKTDNSGNEEWNKTIGGVHNDSANSIIETSDNNYIVLGHTKSKGSDTIDIFVEKINQLGEEEWNRTYETNTNDTGVDIEKTIDGGFVILSRAGIGDWILKGSILIMKIDTNGNEEWNKTYGIEGDIGYSIEQTTDKGFIIVGITISYRVFDQTLWVIKLDVNGNEQWNTTFAEPPYGALGSSILVMQDGYIVLGTTFSNNFVCDANIWLIKIDTNGNEQWNKIYGISDFGENEWGKDIIQTPDGGFVILGDTIDWGFEDYEENTEIIILKIEHEDKEDKQINQWNYFYLSVFLVSLALIVLFVKMIRRKKS